MKVLLYRIIFIHVLILLRVIDVVVLLLPGWCLNPSFYIQGGRGYKEGNRIS
jgi:hypothetical protein